MASRARRRKLARRGAGSVAVVTERIYHPAVARELRMHLRKLHGLRRLIAQMQEKMTRPAIILTDGVES